MTMTTLEMITTTTIMIAAIIKTMMQTVLMTTMMIMSFVFEIFDNGNSLCIRKRFSM